MNPMRHGPKCQINDELNDVKSMISLCKFITSLKLAFRTKIAFSEGENERSVMLEKENEAVRYDELTNKEERRDKYMIYIYILLNLFGILFVIIRHCNENCCELEGDQGGVSGALGISPTDHLTRHLSGKHYQIDACLLGCVNLYVARATHFAGATA